MQTIVLKLTLLACLLSLALSINFNVLKIFQERPNTDYDINWSKTMDTYSASSFCSDSEILYWKCKICSKV